MQQINSGALQQTGRLFTERRQSLFSPGIDFLTVGGLSYIFIIFIQFFPIPLSLNYTLAIGLAYLINDPHFLSSYQLFYGNFKEKISGRCFTPFMHKRYLFAALAIPAAIAGYFAYAYFTSSAQMLFFSANIMLFFVGWHYTKQSYGMLITLSAMKRVFYDDFSKKIFMWNSYIVWFATWIYMNNAISDYNFYGAKLSFFEFPPAVLLTALGLACIFGALTLYCLGVHYKKTGQYSINGIIGYSTAYIWLFFRWSNPMTYLLIPMFHSLQYLPFVLRYKINECHLSVSNPRNTEETILNEGEEIASHVAKYSPQFLVLRFVLIALFLGFLGFHALPYLFDRLVPYDSGIFGSAMFMFMFVVFINIHHYFIDNVLWRKENKDVGKYLFAQAVTPRPSE